MIFLILQFQIVSSWIKEVAQRHRLPKHHIALTSATILTYGSYGLRVHTSVSNIDALCVAPFFASIAVSQYLSFSFKPLYYYYYYYLFFFLFMDQEDFFVLLHHMLKTRHEVSQIHCVKTAKVPLMRFKFDGISIDLPYARLNVLYVPEVSIN